MSVIDNMKIGKKLIAGFLILVSITMIDKISGVVADVRTFIDTVTREIPRLRGQGVVLP